MKKWKKFERQVAEESNGKIQPLSGAGLEKGDVKDSIFLTECKYTEKKSFSISKKLIKKIELEAMKEGLLSKIEISIDGVEVVVLPKKVYKQLIGEECEYGVASIKLEQ